MSWAYVPASVASSLVFQLQGPAPAPFALLSKTSSASESCGSDSPTLQSGATSTPSSAIHGSAASMLSQLDSHVSPGPLPAYRKGPMTRGTSGRESPKSFATFDRVSCSWKTSQASLFEDLDTFSQTWPKWGLMRSGASFPAVPWEPATFAGESQFWPTPKACNADKGGNPRPNDRGDLCASGKMWDTPTACEDEGTGFRTRGTPKLKGQAKLWQTPLANDSTGSQNYTDGTLKLTGQVKQQWPTPTSSEGGGNYGNGSPKLDGATSMWATPCAQENDRKNSTGPWMQLSRQVKPWPTPTALDAVKTYDDRGGLGTVSHGHLAQMEPGSVSPGNYGQLNPRFVQWLMGFPEGWIQTEESSCELWETHIRHLLQLWLGESLRSAS